MKEPKLSHKKNGNRIKCFKRLNIDSILPRQESRENHGGH